MQESKKKKQKKTSLRYWLIGARRHIENQQKQKHFRFEFLFFFILF